MNFLNIGLAFLEGFALILSPCILPILPIMLSSSIEGGKKRPFGIILGFMLSFSAFVLLSRKLINLFNFDPEALRVGSLIFLFVFGLILVSSFLSEKFNEFTQKLSNFGSRLSATQSQNPEGFFSGFLLGCLIGLIWTPCAGPILAAVIVQTIRQETDLASLWTVLAFSFGAGLPMLLISLAGKKLLNKLDFFKQNSEKIRKAFGILILFSVLLMVFPGWKAILYPKDAKTSIKVISGEKLINALPQPYDVPKTEDLKHWINSPPLSLADLKGKVILIDFWTYSCINCVRTLPYIRSWDTKYRDEGLVIIGLHAPEFEFEKNPENVQKAVSEHQLKYPIALDNNLTTWTNFKNKYWPAHYLIDREGKVVYEHFGEGEYETTENNIRYLLGLSKLSEKSNAKEEKIALMETPLTPETYLGYARQENFKSPEKRADDTLQAYSFPKDLPRDSWALKGRWNISEEKIIAGEQGAALRLNFQAKKVFLVLGSERNKSVSAKILLNGQPITEASGKDIKNNSVKINRHTLYELVNQTENKNALLEIQAEDEGLAAYAFTFGN